MNIFRLTGYLCTTIISWNNLGTLSKSHTGNTMPTWAKLISYLRIENHTLSYGTYLYSPYIRVLPTPPLVWRWLLAGSVCELGPDQKRKGFILRTSWQNVKKLTQKLIRSCLIRTVLKPAFHYYLLRVPDLCTREDSLPVMRLCSNVFKLQIQPLRVRDCWQVGSPFLWFCRW